MCAWCSTISHSTVQSDVSIQCSLMMMAGKMQTRHFSLISSIRAASKFTALPWCCSASNDALECRVCSGWRERPALGPGRDQRLDKHQHLLFQLYIYKPVCQSSGLRSHEVAWFQLSIVAADLNTSTGCLKMKEEEMTEKIKTFYFH